MLRNEKELEEERDNIRISLLKPIYSKLNSKWGRWLYMNESNNCAVRYKGESIYDDIDEVFCWLGFGIAFGYKRDVEGKLFYIIDKHIMAWDRCMYGEVARRIWWGRMEVWV